MAIGRALLLLGVSFGLFTTLAATPEPYWPTEAWRVSTPEAQGMDSERLAAMFDHIKQSEQQVHSVVVVRNGYIVAEADLHPFRGDIPHELQSVTKSVTLALVGAAIQRGHIPSVQEPFTNFLVDDKLKVEHLEKRTVTLAHLLSMTSGLRWTEHPYGDPSTSFGMMLGSADWTRFVINQPAVSEPGAVFNYSSGSSHLLATVLERVTGQDLLAFARQSLFEPLGIDSLRWSRSPEGTPVGGFGLALTPRDLAKFGLLYLRDGIWDGRRLLPEGWVRTSTSAQTAARPVAPEYGYGWWVDGDKVIASGSYGQAVVLVPGLDLVAVFTGGSPLPTGPLRLVDEFVIPAASIAPLRDNPGGVAALEKSIRDVEVPERTTARVPPTARRASGRTYHLPDSGLGWTAISAAFGRDDAARTITFRKGNVAFAVGLDNVFRYSSVNGSDIAARGRWLDERTLTVETHFLDGSESLRLRLAFEGDALRLLASSLAAGRSFSLLGRPAPR